MPLFTEDLSHFCIPRHGALNSTVSDYFWLSRSGKFNPCFVTLGTFVGSVSLFGVSANVLILLFMSGGSGQARHFWQLRRSVAFLLKVAFALRLFGAASAVLVCAAEITVQFLLTDPSGSVDFLSVLACGLMCAAMLLHFVMLVFVLRAYAQSYGRRLSRPLVAAILFVLLFQTFHVYNASLLLSTTLSATLRFYASVAVCGLIGVYLFGAFVLCAFGPLRTQAESLLNLSEDSVQIDAEHQSARDAGTQIRLATGDENCSLLSKLTFFWVNKLMLKGYRGQLTAIEELYELPGTLKIETIEQNFDTLKLKQAPKFSLIRVLFALFGVQYFSLGILKFLGDTLSFAGPILLNLLVTYMEDQSEPVSNGYLYALAMFLATLLSSIFSVHFGYLMSKIGLKIRAAILTTIYRKVVNVSAAELSRFSSGQITNFMSTDSDRVINFCPSFHDLWSLPLQVGISFYLLYREVGISFLAGVAFAILLIPLNQQIAVKIGTISTKMMHFKDARVKVMTEMLMGIRVIKQSAWEHHFSAKVDHFRQQELKALAARKYLDAFCVYLWASAPMLVSILTFTTYVLLGNKLTAAKVFTSIAVFNILIRPLNAFPWVINGMVEAWVSAKRLQSFLCMEENDYGRFYNTTTSDDESTALAINAANFSWRRDLQTPSVPSLKNLNLTIEKGKLYGVIGSVGSGKSSLLCALLAELHKQSGEVKLSGQLLEEGFAFVGQESWLQHGTIRDNVLFGAKFDATFYETVLRACALTADVKEMPLHDLSEVGEQGVTLSGGQRTRLSLARAVYQNKSIYLLDDPLAAVDLHIARHLWRHCLRGLLRSKTVILVTHHWQFLREADYVVVMRNGRIDEIGSAADLLSDFSNSRISDLGEGHQPMAHSVSDADLANSILRLEAGTGFDCSLSLLGDAAQNIGSGEAVLVQEEEKEVGTVQIKIYAVYLRAVGRLLVLAITLSLTLMQGSRNASDWWLSYWVAHDVAATNKTSTLLDEPSSDVWTNNYYASKHMLILSQYAYPYTSALALRWEGINGLTFSGQAAISDAGRDEGAFDDAAEQQDTLRFYLAIYGGLVGANTLFTLARAFLYAYGGVVAARVLHKKLLRKILQAPVQFFDTTPVGRLVNRFSSDLWCVDDSLPFQGNRLVMYIFAVISTIAMVSYGLPWFLLLVLPIGVVYYYIQNYYRFTTCDLKRLSSVSLSPIYSHFTDTLNGAISIRAFRAVDRFIERNRHVLTENQRAQFASLACGQWLATRLQLLGVLSVSAIALIAVLQHKYQTIDPGLVGLAISYALSITGLLTGAVSAFTETEKELVSVERINHYIDQAPSERIQSVFQVALNWPKEGLIEFRRVCLRYGPNLPRALLNVSFTIKPGEKIGVVGRTGSGKSSLLQALLRIVELDSGSILIDGTNIGLIDLHRLRSAMAVIPQQPFLFSGSVRQNLDIADEYDDAAILRVVSICCLDEVVTRLGGLDGDVGERGSKLSVGEKQLLCLGRALLKQTKVICIDEATANVDTATEQNIQRTMREAFKECTVLTIAHRINTILESDRILVMDDGQKLEFGTPAELMQRENGYFSSLVGAKIGSVTAQHAASSQSPHRDF